MKKHRYLSIPAFILGCVTLALGHGALAGVQFSADLQQTGPRGERTQGKMFVGEDRVRMEMSHQGQQIVRITDENRGIEWVLFPAQKQYMERKLPPRGMSKPSAENPCAGAPQMRCQKLGETSVAGRPAVVWEISQRGKEGRIKQWIDQARGPAFILRQELPNGQQMERVFLGKDTFAGRPVEKWRVDLKTPDGKQMQSFEWYDPALKTALKQEYPQGMGMALSNIHVGPQPDQLFNVPAGFGRMTAPPGMSGPGSFRPQR